MSVYEKIKALNIELPPVAKPVAAYVMYVQSGNLVYPAILPGKTANRWLPSSARIFRLKTAKSPPATQRLI